MTGKITTGAQALQTTETRNEKSAVSNIAERTIPNQQQPTLRSRCFTFAVGTAASIAALVSVFVLGGAILNGMPLLIALAALATLISIVALIASSIAVEVQAGNS